MTVLNGSFWDLPSMQITSVVPIDKSNFHIQLTLINIAVIWKWFDHITKAFQQLPNQIKSALAFTYQIRSCPWNMQGKWNYTKLLWRKICNLKMIRLKSWFDSAHWFLIGIDIYAHTVQPTLPHIKITIAWWKSFNKPFHIYFFL